MARFFLFLAMLGSISTVCANPEALVASTFKLFNKDSTATCFLMHQEDSVDQPIIVTAAHVLKNMTGDEALLVLRKTNDDGSHSRHDHKVKIRDGKKDLWIQHPKQDIAVLPFTPPENISCPTLPISTLLPKADFASIDLTICGQAFLLTYPERFEANGAGFPAARGATIASFPTGPAEHHPSFLADLSAFGGDSGGPVFVLRKKKELPIIIGVSIAQFHHDEKIKILREEGIRRHPLGFGKILHAQFVLETLELAQKKD